MSAAHGRGHGVGGISHDAGDVSVRGPLCWRRGLPRRMEPASRRAFKLHTVRTTEA